MFAPGERMQQSGVSGARWNPMDARRVGRTRHRSLDLRAPARCARSIGALFCGIQGRKCERGPGGGAPGAPFLCWSLDGLDRRRRRLQDRLVPCFSRDADGAAALRRIRIGRAVARRGSAAGDPGDRHPDRAARRGTARVRRRGARASRAAPQQRVPGADPACAPRAQPRGGRRVDAVPRRPRRRLSGVRAGSEDPRAGRAAPGARGGAHAGLRGAPGGVLLGVERGTIAPRRKEER